LANSLSNNHICVQQYDIFSTHRVIYNTLMLGCPLWPALGLSFFPSLPPCAFNTILAASQLLLPWLAFYYKGNTFSTAAFIIFGFNIFGWSRLVNSLSNNHIRRLFVYNNIISLVPTGSYIIPNAGTLLYGQLKVYLYLSQSLAAHRCGNNESSKVVDNLLPVTF